MKKEIRRLMLKRRAEVSEEEKTRVEDAVFKNLTSLEIFANAGSCFCYVDFKNEVPTKKIRDYFSEKVLLVPLINGEQMYAVIWREGSKLNDFGIEEPKEYEIVQKSPDISIIPLLACDRNGNRIGFGKGYYDKYLANKTTVKVGICYDFQLLKQVPFDEGDQRLDYVVTEKRIIKV